MRNFALGIAAIALAATGANAQPGNGNGNGNGKNKSNGPAEQSMKGPKDRGNGNGKANKADRGPDQMRGNGNNDRNMAKADRKNDDRRMASRVNDNAKAKGNGNGNAKAQNRDTDRYADDMRRGNGKPDRVARYAGNRDSRDRYDRDRYDRDRDGPIFGRFDDRVRSSGLVDGCPPGLAKKNNGCTPPGLAKRDDRYYDRSDWWGLPGLTDGRYRYFDGNLVRLSDRGGIQSYYPLLGGALSVGNQWPDWYQSQPVPSYYESYYGLGNDYRYADNTLYRVNPENAAITSIAALLTGDTIRVGQRMPSGYSVYNVPYNYRDQYYDTSDRSYRYSDGYVYEIDPTTQLVAAAIDLVL